MSGLAYGSMPPGAQEPDHDDIAQLLGGGGQAQAPQAPDPLGALQDAIHAVAAAMSALPDPVDTQDAAQALLGLTKIQTRLMGSQGNGAPPPR